MKRLEIFRSGGIYSLWLVKDPLVTLQSPRGPFSVHGILRKRLTTMPPLEAFVWKILSKDACVLFGHECAAVASWTVIIMVLRTILSLAQIDSYIPLGIICGFPASIQLFSRYVPTLRQRNPLLPIRLAESIVAKSNISKIFVLFPAHFLGSLIGLVLFRSFLPFAPRSVMEPIFCEPENKLIVASTEIVANFLVSCSLLVLPYVLEVNNLSQFYASVPLLPLYALSFSAFNPSLIFGLWSLNSNVLSNNFCSLNVLRISCSSVGALLAGWICGNYYPDDPSSWTRTPKKSK